MNYIFSFIFGIVQGLTEFIPVSSSGHLILLHKLINFNLIDNLAFDVALHFGTFLALLLFFYKDFIVLIEAWLKSFRKWNLKEDSQQRLSWLVFISILPAVLVGFLFEEKIEALFYSPKVIIIMLISLSLVFIIVEKKLKFKDELFQLTWKSAFLIGLAQVIAFIPGTSRSGVTIVSGMALGLKREEAARFSFFMAAPLIFGASLLKLFDLYKLNLNASEISIFIIGVSVSTITGYFAIKYLLKFISNNKLNIFAYYRIILAILISIYLIFI